MPCEVVYADGGLSIRYYGVLTSAEIYDSFQCRLNHPEQLMNFSTIVADYTDVAEMRVPDLNIQLLAEQYQQMSKHAAGVMVAVIAPSDLQYGLGRMWQAHLGEMLWEHMIFRSRDEADSWLESKRRQRRWG